MDGPEVAARLHALLLRRGLTVSSAESLTGGGLGALLSSTPGASATFRGGVVAYATDVKRALLGVSDELLARHGVVSAECATRMAVGVRELVGSDWAVSTTGVAGPTEQEGQPVGTVFVGVAGPGDARAVRLRLDGDRATVRRGAGVAALGALLDALDPGPG